MLQKIDHIGIAVKDLNASIKLYERLLGTNCFKIETVATEKVVTAFFQLEGIKIELIAASEEDSTISTFIEKHGEGLHHIAFQVDDLKRESERLQVDEFQLINEKAKSGADNKLINFIKPGLTGKVLIELCADQEFI